MKEYEIKDFEKLLKRNMKIARTFMRETESSAVRLYDRNIESFNLTVDLYGEYSLVNVYEEIDEALVKDILCRYAYLKEGKIIFKKRNKREGRKQGEKGEESLTVEVMENSLLFECELKKYSDTGLFLDQVISRSFIKSVSENKKVLNLFSYTGSFSVYAAAGEAEEVTSVDLSNVYSEWTRRNLRRNGFLSEKKYKTVTQDALSFLKDAKERKEKFDIVIFDPPSFSNSHKAKDFDIKKDYLYFLSLINSVLKEGGLLLFSSNLSSFALEKGRIKNYWKTEERTGEFRAPLFAAKKSNLRIWTMSKIKDMESRREMEKKEKREKESYMGKDEFKRHDGKGRERDSFYRKKESYPREGEKRGKRSYENSERYKEERKREREYLYRSGETEENRKRSDFSSEHRKRRSHGEERRRTGYDYALRKGRKDYKEREEKRDYGEGAGSNSTLRKYRSEKGYERKSEGQSGKKKRERISREESGDRRKRIPPKPYGFAPNEEE